MQRIERTEGIVIKCKDLTETSQLVWLYTKNHGKCKVVAKGSRKRSKRFKSKLDLFSQNEMVFYYHPKNDLHTLSEYEVIDPFTEIRSDISKMAVASYMIELLDSLVGIEDPNLKIYSLVFNSLKWLGETDKLWFLKIIFEIKLLHYSGEFKVPDDVSKGVYAIIKRVVQSQDVDTLKKLKVSDFQLKELKDVIGLIVDYSVGKRLKSLDFLEEVCEPEMSNNFIRA